MRKINFSHNYIKLQDQTSATLLAVFPLKLSRNDVSHNSLSQFFIDYDTAIKDGGNYKLRSGEYVVLLFLGNKSIPFTTIRSRIGMYGLNKEEYYTKHIGEEFEIVIKEKPE